MTFDLSAKQVNRLVRAAFPKGVRVESEHLGYEEHHQSDVGREDDCQSSEGKGSVLLRGQDHGHRSRDQAQHLQEDGERDRNRWRETKRNTS